MSCAAVSVGVDRAAGLMVGEREISIVGFREEASTSLLLAEKYLSLLEIGVMSMTMLEDWMEDLERCLNIDRDRETFARWRMMLSFTCVFAKCPMPFRKGTERLLRRVPRNLPLLLREGVTCHFGCRTSFGGASGNEETERDMVRRWEGVVRLCRNIYVKRDGKEIPDIKRTEARVRWDQ